MFTKLWSAKVVRFAVVGVFNTLLDVTILNLLVVLAHFPAVLANLISASTSICVSYFLNHRFVFRSDEPHSVKRFIHFFVATGFGILAIQSLIIYIITHILGHHAHTIHSIVNHLPVHISAKEFDLNVAKLIAVAIAMVWNFMIYRLVIFKQHPQTADPADFELPL